VSWARLRREIYARDGGRCRACGLRVGKVWDAGHLQDRIVGGADELENLALMCTRCNRTLKPVTPTRTEASDWLEHTRNPRPIDWQSMWELAQGKVQDGTQALAEHERLE
jgi:5-methylcytosine-specific restriction endonuclease McrA